MRCLALADAWEAAGGDTVVMTDPSVAARIEATRGHRRQFVAAPSFGEHAEAAVETARAAASTASAGDPWIVADGYHFSESFHRTVRDAGLRLVAIDDTVRLPSYAANVVLNQNPGAEGLEYVGDDDTQLLLGTRYTMLRPQVTAQAAKAAHPAVARRLVVTMGGADPQNVTTRVINAVRRVKVPGLEVTVVVGPLNAHRPDIESAARRCAIPVRIAVNPPDLPALMANADAAVSAAGSTAWELLFLGVPSVLIPIADNQRPIVDAVRAGRAAELFGEPGDVDPAALADRIERLCHDVARREDLSGRARRFIDGRGAARVVECLGQGSLAPFARLRRAEEGDVGRAWEISNDPEVRRQAFNPSAIPYEHHVQWYQARLRSPRTIMWVLDAGGDVAAQIRYDRSDDGAAVISFSVASSWRGRGLGERLLASTWRRACSLLDVDRARGVTFLANPASQRAFEAAGFADRGTETIEGRECRVFERIRVTSQTHAAAH